MSVGNNAETGERGVCPKCGGRYLLKRDGTLRHHGGPPGTGPFTTYKSYRCAGVGMAPLNSNDR